MIVGAGPVGLITALVLAQQGIARRMGDRHADSGSSQAL